MGTSVVSRTLGLQRIDGCCSQPLQARERKNRNGGKAEATMEGKRSERVGEGGRRKEQAGGKKGGRCRPERGRNRAGGESRRVELFTDSPDALEEATFHRRTLGLIYRFTQMNPL